MKIHGMSVRHRRGWLSPLGLVRDRLGATRGRGRSRVRRSLHRGHLGDGRGLQEAGSDRCRRPKSVETTPEILTADGYKGWEGGCSFTSVKENGAGKWTVETDCRRPPRNGRTTRRGNSIAPRAASRSRSTTRRPNSCAAMLGRGTEAVTDLTGLTLAEARDGLKAKKFSATELTKAHIEAIEAANAALNAYVLPDARGGAGSRSRKRRAPCQGRGAPARGPAARQQGSVRHQGRAHDRVLEDPRRLQAHV